MILYRSTQRKWGGPQTGARVAKGLWRRPRRSHQPRASV